MNLKLKKLALCIGVSFTVMAATPTYALLVSTTVTTSTSTSINGITTSDTSGPAASSESHTSANSGRYGGALAYAHSAARADNTGFSSLTSTSNTDFLIDGYATIQTSAQSLHTTTVKNDSDVGQAINFDFIISSGSLGLGWIVLDGMWDPTSDASGLFIQSGYSADIRLNGTSLWSSGASLTNNITVWSEEGQWREGELTHTGTAAPLNNAGAQYDENSSQYSYSWADYYGNLSLGYLAPGASFTLEYQLSTYINEVMNTIGYANAPRATIGDPFNLNGTPIYDANSFNAVNASPVSKAPEPAPLLLLGAGLMGLAFRRKSRKA